VVITGKQFSENSTAEVGSHKLKPEFVSSIELHVTIPNALLEAKKDLPIIVVNPGPTGRSSESATLSVTE